MLLGTYSQNYAGIIYLVVALEGIHKSIESMPPIASATAANVPLEDSGWVQQEDQHWKNYEGGEYKYSE